MLMDGVGILEKTPIYEWRIFDFVAIVGILMSVFLIIVFSIIGKIKPLIIFAVTFSLFYIYTIILMIYENNGNKEISRYEYKIEIQDYSKIDMAEFSDKYEIIKIDENVWTIEEKEEKE